MNDEISTNENDGAATEAENTNVKCEEYLNGWKRALADYDNLKKDLARERERINSATREETVIKIVPVLDNLNTALKHASEESARSLIEGLNMISKQLEQVLNEFGATKFGAIGEQFDTNLHDAIGARNEDEKSDDEILEIIASGWKFADKVIRPAKVIVNQARPNDLNAKRSVGRES